MSLLIYFSQWTCVFNGLNAQEERLWLNLHKTAKRANNRKKKKEKTHKSKTAAPEPHFGALPLSSAFTLGAPWVHIRLVRWGSSFPPCLESSGKGIGVPGLGGSPHRAGECLNLGHWGPAFLCTKSHSHISSLGLTSRLNSASGWPFFIIMKQKGMSCCCLSYAFCKHQVISN